MSLHNVISRADSLVDHIGRLAAWLGFLLVLLVAANVLARYLFSAGTVALQELEWHILAVCALIGMSYGLNQGDEVRVDIFYAKYGPRTKAATDVLSGLLTVIVALIMAKLSVHYVEQSFSYREGSPDPGGLPYRFMLKAFIPAGFLLLALQGVVQTYRAFRLLRTPAAPVQGRRPTHGD